MEANHIALLVDDEASSRAAQQSRLEDQGYTVFVALNQADAVSRAKQTAPKIIFAHLGTSGLRNLALIQALRCDDNTPHIPLLVLRDTPAVAPKPPHLPAPRHPSP